MISEYFKRVTLRNNRLSYKVYRGLNKNQNIKIVGIIRMRNESELIQDTLDHFSKFVDGVIIYDDCSDDNSMEIALAHPLTLKLIRNKRWRAKHRAWEETANRGLAMEYAKKYNPEWFFYADCDERFEGEIREYLLNCSQDIEGIRIQLLDAYITNNDQEPYGRGRKLYNFRKLFGIEQRDILMIWRNNGIIGYNYHYPDMREPLGFNERKIVTKFYCQHYGKALSIQQWEDTCDYYINNFPGYAEKWSQRKGQAVHSESDFGTKLLIWEEAKENAQKIN